MRYLFWCGLGLWMALGVVPAEAARAPLRIVVSSHPVAATLATLAPADVEVTILLERGASPHDATLRPRQVQALLDADVLIWWGAGAEPWLQPWRARFHGRELDLSRLEGLQRWPVRSADEDEPATFDVHLWWSRQNLQLASRAMADLLAQSRPDQAPALAARLTANESRWAQVAARAQALGQRRPGYVVFHDGWQYFERDMGLVPEARLIAHEALGSGVRHLAGLKERFAAQPVACVIVEPGMNTALVDKLLPGVRQVLLDPHGWDVPGDALAMLSHALDALEPCVTPAALPAR